MVEGSAGVRVAGRARESGCAGGHSACVAQLVEHFLGKEEVTGSIPVASSRISRVQFSERGRSCETSYRLSARTASAGTTRQRRTRRSIPVAWSTRSSAAGAASTRRTRKPARRLLVRREVPTLRRSHRRYPLRGAVGTSPANTQFGSWYSGAPAGDGMEAAGRRHVRALRE